MRVAFLPSGESVSALGLGTWMMGERPDKRTDEIAALNLALDLGMNVVDTAEMYGNGGAEKLIAKAVGHRRGEMFLVSKVLPQHATRAGTVAACNASLKRLNTNHLDLYLLHWRGSVPLEDTLAGFDDLTKAGKVRHWGVSNFDVDDMEELMALPGGTNLQTNQVLYNLTRRGIEFDFVPWCRKRRIPTMAYSPIEQGRLLKNARLKSIAARHGATPAQIALAWVLRQNGVIAIPKAGTPDHVRENAAAVDITLTPQDLTELDSAFPAPRKKVTLELL
jgi:Aldo/keto reductases, related to diketogulonate reductase